MRLLRSLGAALCIAAGVAFPDRASFPWDGSAAVPAPGLVGEGTGVRDSVQMDERASSERRASAWGAASCWIDASVGANPSPWSRVDPDAPTWDAPCTGNDEVAEVERDGALSIVDLQATLPVGNPYAPMIEGIYYFAIAQGFADPAFDAPPPDGASPGLTGRAPWLDGLDVSAPEEMIEAARERDGAPFETDASASAVGGETGADPATLSSLLVAALGLIAWRRGGA